MYALPGETLYNAKLSAGVTPPGVNCPELNIPSLPVLSFNDSNAVISKAFT